MASNKAPWIRIYNAVGWAVLILFIAGLLLHWTGVMPPGVYVIFRWVIIGLFLANLILMLIFRRRGA